MWTFVSTGHRASCEVFRGPNTSCSSHCEAALYLAVGILAFIAAFLGIGIGITAGAFAFSEGMHALADGGADFYGTQVVRRAMENPARREEIRRKGNLIIAGLLALATTPILWEMWRRFEEIEIPFADLMVFAGVIAIVMNSVRRSWLQLAQRRGPTSTRKALIKHAKADTAHGWYLFTVGAVLLEYAGEWQKGTLLFVDLVLSGGLFCYILWMAWSIVRRHGHH